MIDILRVEWGALESQNSLKKLVLVTRLKVSFSYVEREVIEEREESQRFFWRWVLTLWVSEKTKKMKKIDSKKFEKDEKTW